MDIKTKLYKRMQHMFKVEEEVDETWLNDNIVVHIKDNTPTGRNRKVDCEFCGRSHTSRDDICDIRTEEVESGNTLEGAK